MNDRKRVHQYARFNVQPMDTLPLGRINVRFTIHALVSLYFCMKFRELNRIHEGEIRTDAVLSNVVALRLQTALTRSERLTALPQLRPDQ